MTKNTATRTSPRPPRAPHRPLGLVVIAGVVVAVLGGLFAIFNNSTSSHNGSSAKPSYQVGAPGPGKMAPGFTLASTAGGHASLADFHGKNVLLYFQEGLSCQPCWDQLTNLEHNAAAIHAAGIDRIVSITTDPVKLLRQKTHDMGLSTPVLSDPDLTASHAYHASEYGMMGDSRDGHTFILVGPDGRIRWRADYGGAPKYTMFVPTNQLMADLRAGRS